MHGSLPRVRIAQPRIRIKKVADGDEELLRASPDWKGLTDKQDEARDLMGGPQTHTCLYGGSRSGKTFVITRAIIIRALKSEGSRHLFARLHGNAVRASVWLDTFPKVLRLCFPHIKTKTYRSDGFEEFENGAQCWFGGLDDKDRVEKILGQEYVTIYPGECSQIPYSSILTLRTRLAQPGTGLNLRAFYDLNPVSKMHWTHKEFKEKKNPLSRESIADPQNYKFISLNPEDNKQNLDPTTLQLLRNMPKQYKQRFYAGEYTDEVEGALWTPDQIQIIRCDPVEPDSHGNKLGEFTRIAIGVDPSGAMSKFDIKSDEIGIVAAGKTHMNHAVVLEDATIRGGPKEWGRRVVATFKKWHADIVVAEANFGGAMVASTIHAIDPNVPVKLVTASRGKVVRAEPVAALYDEEKVEHAGYFPELEEQLCLFTRGGYTGDKSPDRADAKIWAMHELMLDPTASGYVLGNMI